MDATVGALAAQLNGEVIGDADLVVIELMPLGKAGPSALSFLADDTPIRLLDRSSAGAVLISESRLADISDDQKTSSTFILVEDAMASFLSLVEAEQPRRARLSVGISPKAIVPTTTSIGENSNIHAGVVLGENVVIGVDCDIHPGAVIGDGCQIGDQCSIYPNTVLYADCVLQDRVIIHANAVIGADGFGYRFNDGAFQKIEHFGYVLLENDVEIGAGATVDRGMIGPTILREGTKIDNLVMIAHNCEIGKHNAFASQVGVAGSASTGDYVRCGGQAGIADHIHVGEGSSVGAMSGVTRDLAAGQTYLGAPARPAEITHKILMAQTKLPEMRVKLRDLTKQVAQLEAKIKRLQSPEEFNDAA
jgi:UDP-3-O-[3-hydroxymyristoyl] glucosamine N-acyltransferase